jgi:phage protein U
MITAGLGIFRFSIKTASYDKFKRATKYHWATQKQIGAKTTRQFVGRGDDLITLSGVIYPEHNGGLNQIEKMRKIANEGKALELFFSFDALATVNGLWCIESISEGQTYFHTNGQPRKQEFSIELAAY